MERIYLDYAASAPLAPEAKEIIRSFDSAQDDKLVGNPSSLHGEGRAMQAKLDKAHTTLAAVFGVEPTEVIFTSGATEANNLAIRGVLEAWQKDNKGTPHVVISSVEHPSVYQTVRATGAEVTMVEVNKQGVVNVDDVIKAIKPNTALVSCIYAQNEIGTIQPVAEIGKQIEGLKQKWPVFHVDAVQAFPYLNTHFGHVHCDLMTISGHKYGALQGVGALLAKKATPLVGVIKGGQQEWGKRAGTENVFGAITLAEVVNYLDANRDQVTNHAQALQKQLETVIRDTLPKVKILGAGAPRVPHITYLWLERVIDEHIVHKLDLAGVAVSSGSACSSGAMLPSATLLAMGYSDQEAFGGLRVSYGRFTTENEIAEFVKRLKEII